MNRERKDSKIDQTQVRVSIQQGEKEIQFNLNYYTPTKLPLEKFDLNEAVYITTKEVRK